MNQKLVMLAIICSPMMFVSCSRPQPQVESDINMVVDLARHTLSNSKVGQPIESKEFPFGDLTIMNRFDLPEKGIELGARETTFTYLFLTIPDFDGSFAIDGESVSLQEFQTPELVVEKFGEPYWRDVDVDGEMVLFYVYDEGGIEVQFEFTDGKTLSFLLITSDGVLSDPEQREAYGVDKPWPPVSD